jgi:hypothetical protein
MKLLFSAALFLITILGKAQNIGTENGMIKFNSIADYVYYADNEVNRTSLDNFSKNSSVATLSKQTQPVDDEIVPGFLQMFLNTDNMVTIGNYLIKFDFVGNRALLLNKNAANAITTLQNNDISQSGVMVLGFNDVDNGVEIFEGLENGTITETNYQDAINNTSTAEKCRHAGGNKSANSEVWSTLKMYEHYLNRDITTDCSGDLVDYIYDYKMVYQRLVFYFKIECKAKGTTHCSGYNSSSHEIKKDIHVFGNIRYEVRCFGEQEKKYDVADYTRVNNWSPYDGSRSLSRYDFTASCQTKHTWDVTYPHSIPLHIVDGY